ncbi:uncharacterized protein LOC133533639 isoform X2 [Cydia pomonella]|uniref:uncharacterized protein LOC133533639 isoform X2 n=1 Tax=Cydia pomonella TaxID=82600 RepID=UPI002ADDF279|nr:uncharacterized protein LOC133533639 isoform X2 [Cydia pomonella]
MRQVPECFERRYQAMDALVKDLSSVTNQSNETNEGDPDAKDDYGFKLMCKFWNILKEDPVCDLQNIIQQRTYLSTRNSGIFGSQKISCYQMGNDPRQCGKGSCAKTIDLESKASGSSCCDRQPKPQRSPQGTCCSKHGTEPVTPLSQALENMKRAASTEKKCYEKATELLTVQEQLKEQIAQLEQREQDEIKLLKEADSIWKAMENEYKQKLEESKRRQEELLRELTEVELSASKWKKNKKNLEEQMSTVDKCILEMREICRKKTNDLKTIQAETADLEKKLACNTNDIMNTSETLEAKRKCHDDCMKKLSEESKKLQLCKKHEEQLKKEKIEKGGECVKEAREELALICRVLLKKKLENEDIRAEAKALAEEIDLLQTSCDTCGEKCKNKEQSLKSELEECECEIKKFKLKCTKCNVSCDTDNLRKHCTDCPRCKEEMESCVYSADTCEGPAKPCVCVKIKTQFMNNVFDNMQTVLERQINTRPGKVVAAQVLQCLKNSTNGKLDCVTRKKLQEFILATVKTNLNLTIIGGAVKTRCEMDPATYKELLKCLTTVKAKKPEKADKGTDSRKEPCARWGGPNECNCPKGPKNCICLKKAPKPASDPEPCGQLEEDKKDIGQLSICPHKDNTPCGPLCGNSPDIAKTLAKSYKPKPCCGEKCTFNSNMRAAQCTLGSDCIDNKVIGTKGCKTNTPIIQVPFEQDQMQCDCSTVYKTCHCCEITDRKMNRKRGFQQEVTLPSEAEFKEMFYHNNTTLPVTILGQNGTSADFNAELRVSTNNHGAKPRTDR